MTKECCEFLLHEIAFYKDSIRPCCSFSINDEDMPFIDGFKGKKKDVEDYFKKRKKFINEFLKGKKPICYKNCTVYEKNKNNNINFKLNNLIISNQTKCSCNCIYCEHSSYGKKNIRTSLNKYRTYDIKPILSYIRDHNYINEGCRMIICGGECTEYPECELEWLIYFGKVCSCELLILSSGIIYSKPIENALKTGNTSLKISIDSGRQETFEAIKRVKAHDIVWNNIKKYIENADSDKNSFVELKYILIPGINDNIEEFDAFIDKVKEVNCTKVCLDVEHQYLQKNRNNEETKKHIGELFNYCFEKMRKINETTYFTHVGFEGVDENWLWSIVDEKYNFKKSMNNEV